MKLKSLTLWLLLFVAVHPLAMAQKAGGERTITEKENGKTISIVRGKSFNVLFKKECIGCRYKWDISAIDTARLKFVKSTYANGPKPGLVGGAQDHTFHFKALKRGRSALAFTMGDEKFSVTILVK